ncbi:MAG TPA: thioredoxin domain-containing protein [Herpetosiphonaceae bacterium]
MARSVRGRRSLRLGWFYGAFVALALVGGLMVARAAGPLPFSAPVSSASLNLPAGLTADGFWYKGAADAPVEVVVYSDFQCPFCALLHERLAAARFDERFVAAGKVRYVYRDLPLRRIHGSAVASARLARIAGDAGQFWLAHDTLLASQARWSAAADPLAAMLDELARAGLPADQLRARLAAGDHLQAVADAERTALLAGLGGTPTVFVNGRPVALGADPGADLAAAVEAALAGEARP